VKILIASSECDPYAKVGGLGDVIPSLGVALKKLGHDVRIVLPKYASINYVSECSVVNDGNPMIVNMGYGTEFAQLLQTEYKSVPVYFIEFNRYFARPGIYGEKWQSYGDNWERFAFFCRAAVDMCPFLEWAPDIIHSNDWPTGLIPVLLHSYSCPKVLKNTKSVFTIHNMEHHGYGPRRLLKFLGLESHFWHPFAMEACGSVNVMKGALQFADRITTVSKTYAEEIKTPAYGCGLDDVLRYRAGDLIGICNGIDGEIWNPANDGTLAQKFSPQSMEGKKACKQKLQGILNLPRKRDVPIFAVVSRFCHQKGLDILCDALPDILKNMEIQFVILGCGDQHLEWQFKEMENNFRGKIAAKIGFDGALSHLIYAASDFFVMPSRYEPCGLTQMQAMAYGALPIVHGTGGLIDSVENYNESTGHGTGFVFKDFTALALGNTIGWACATYYDRSEDFKRLQKSAMEKDFSWRKSVKEYEKAYEYALGPQFADPHLRQNSLLLS
jgi:starch synthase